MSEFDLLDTVQPPGGWFAVVGIKDGGRVKQDFVQTREEVDDLVDNLVKGGWNAFFGVAKYKTKGKRTKDNVLGLKAFWLDIDCGESKAAPNPKTGLPGGYIDQSAGIAALKVFCREVGLPKPVIVNSGRGIHAYWPLEEEITREQWEPVADRLRASCVEHGLHVDPAVFEVARVLRVPGTYNFKDDPATLVEVLSSGKPTPFPEFCKFLGLATAPVVEVSPPKRPLSALALSLRGNEISLFDKIMQRKPGCAQLKDCYRSRATLSEPRWFNALSVAKFCDDQDTAIHQMSSGHPDYDPVAVQHKIAHILGPATCVTFERTNPGGCNGCPHKGNIKSPIVLGRDIATTPNGDAVVQDETDPSKTHVIPKYPYPYARGETGGIYKKVEDKQTKKGEVIPGGTELVYEQDVYAVKRMYDPALGDVVVMKYHAPSDGIKQFTIPNKCVADKNELRLELAKYGVLCTGSRYEDLFQCIILSIKNLQVFRKAENMRLQFGWADNFSKFIIGDREISKDGIFHSPPSNTTKEKAALLVPKGSLEKWKEVFNLYGRKGLEPHAFAALTAFGSPLFGFLGQSGALINLINPGSGQGKSTVLHMCNSVYGHPKDLCFKQDDTLNGKIQKLGIFNNLPATFDEMTSTRPADLSTLMYSISTGIGKDRMKQSSNELRENNTRWNLLALCSSNASFYDKLTTLKDSPDGEMMRAIEYQIDTSTAIDAAYGKQMFDHQLFENYGLAGDIYAQWLVNNLEEAKSICIDVQAKVDLKLNLTQRERFWSAIVAANFAGALIAKRLGLFDWDLAPVYNWACNMVLELRKEVIPPTLNSMTVLGDFINRHMQNALVVNDAVDRRTNKGMLPTMEPRGELVIRLEPDTQKMYIPVKQFRADCTKNQVSYADTIRKMREQGILLDTKNTRMTKGMKLVAPGVTALVLNTAHKDFEGMVSALMPEAPEGEAVVDEAVGG